MKQRREKINKRFKPFSATFLALAMVFILQISLVYAWNFDNTYSYDPNTDEVLITNAFGFGDDLAYMKLTWGDTEVGVGIDTHVGSFNFTSLNGNVTDLVFEDIDLVNLKNGQVMTRGKQYKVAIYKQDDKFIEVCTGSNETFDYECHLEEDGKIWVKEWTPISNPNFEFIVGQEYEIGVFVDTEEGDKGDWIPSILGVQVDEWATWSAELNNGLIAYYTLDETSGTTAYDSIGTFNLTESGSTSTPNSAGKIDQAWNFNNDNNHLVSSSNSGISGDESRSIAGWIKPDTTNTILMMGIGAGSSNDEFALGSNSSGAFSVVGFANDNTANAYITAGVWNHLVATHDGTTMRMYLNGVSVLNVTETYSTTDAPIRIGSRAGWAAGHDGLIDEVGLWNRSLTHSEVIQLYNEGTGITYSAFIDNPPEITLTAPANNSNLTQSSETFQATITDDINLVSACLLIDDVCVDNDTSPVNGSNSFTGTFSEGVHNWSIIAYDNSSQSTTSDVRFFNYTQAPIVITLYQPEDNLITNDNTQEFIVYVESPITLDNVTFVTSGYANITNTSGANATNYTFNRALTENSWTWYVRACDTDDNCLNSAVRNIEIDDTRPSVSITAPIDGSFFLENQTLNLNWTATDANLEDCWYNYNGVNNSLTCSANTTTFNLVTGQDTITFYANDTATNLRTVTYVFNVTAVEGDWSYPTSILEGSTGEWQLNITTDGTSPNSVYLVYDGTPILGNINEYGTNQYTLSASKTAPGVTSSTNYTAYFSMTMSDLQILNSTSKIQTVNNFGIDNCSLYNETLFNFTLYNEKTLAILNGTGDNTLGNLNLQLYSRDDGSKVLEFEEQYSQQNPFIICLENNITSSDEYNYNLELEYTADNFAREYYYISNEILNDDDLNTKIPLYLLANTSAQSYKITYKDANFLPVSGVIQLQRKYIDEGVYRTVEQPKMDSNGQVILQVELEDAVYNINVLVSGEVDATFSDIRFYCPNPLIENCEDELNSFESGGGVTDYESINGVTFSLAYNDSTRTISVPFVVTTGTSKNMGLNVKLFDAFGNTSVCTDTLVSSGGTLSCVVPNSFGNATVIAELTDAGSTIAQTTVRLDSFGQDQYGFSIVVIGIVAVMLLIMIGLTPGEPLLYGVFLIIGTVLLGALNIIFSTSWVGAGATLLWFMIAVIVIIIKGGDR